MYELTKEEIKAAAILQMLGNASEYICKRCGKPLLKKGHSVDDWIDAGNRHAFCAACREQQGEVK